MAERDGHKVPTGILQEGPDIAGKGAPRDAPTPGWPRALSCASTSTCSRVPMSPCPGVPAPPLLPATCEPRPHAAAAALPRAGSRCQQRAAGSAQERPRGEPRDAGTAGWDPRGRVGGNFQDPPLSSSITLSHSPPCAWAPRCVRALSSSRSPLTPACCWLGPQCSIALQPCRHQAAAFRSPYVTPGIRVCWEYSPWDIQPLGDSSTEGTASTVPQVLDESFTEQDQPQPHPFVLCTSQHRSPKRTSQQWPHSTVGGQQHRCPPPGLGCLPWLPAHLQCSLLFPSKQRF